MLLIIAVSYISPYLRKETIMEFIWIFTNRKKVVFYFNQTTA